MHLCRLWQDVIKTNPFDKRKRRMMPKTSFMIFDTTWQYSLTSGLAIRGKRRRRVRNLSRVISSLDINYFGGFLDSRQVYGTERWLQGDSGHPFSRPWRHRKRKLLTRRSFYGKSALNTEQLPSFGRNTRRAMTASTADRTPPKPALKNCLTICTNWTTA